MRTPVVIKREVELIPIWNTVLVVANRFDVEASYLRIIGLKGQISKLVTESIKQFREQHIELFGEEMPMTDSEKRAIELLEQYQ